MAQLNINVTNEFEKNLRLLMQKKEIKTKSEAIRYAVKEALNRDNIKNTNFNNWLGLAKDHQNASPKFNSVSELWEKSGS